MKQRIEHRHRKAIWSALFSAAALSGCGGGSSADGSPAAAGVQPAARGSAITAVTPTPGTRDFALTASVRLMVDAPLDSSTVHADTVELVDDTGARVESAIAYEPDARVIEVAPLAPLRAGARYAVRLSSAGGGIRNAAGQPMADGQATHFTTAAGELVRDVHATAVAGPGRTTLNVDFKPASEPALPGMLSDSGQPFDATRGYGWIDGHGQPLSLEGNARARHRIGDQRLDTFLHMALPTGSTGVHTEGRWKALLANGSYRVTVAAGDASYLDSHHVIRANGATLLNFRPAEDHRTALASGTVTVTDGTLILDQAGGSNTKIAYVEIVPAALQSQACAAAGWGVLAQNAMQDYPVGTDGAALKATGEWGPYDWGYSTYRRQRDGYGPSWMQRNVRIESDVTYGRVLALIGHLPQAGAPEGAALAWYGKNRSAVNAAAGDTPKPIRWEYRTKMQNVPGYGAVALTWPIPERKPRSAGERVGWPWDGEIDIVELYPGTNKASGGESNIHMYLSPDGKSHPHHFPRLADGSKGSYGIDWTQWQDVAVDLIPRQSVRIWSKRPTETQWRLLAEETNPAWAPNFPHRLTFQQEFYGRDKVAATGSQARWWISRVAACQKMP